MFYKLKPFADSVFNIVYKRPESVPVRIDVSDKVITITGYVEFDPKLLVPFKKSEKINDALLSSKPEGYTYADAAIEGICENWGKSYLFEGATEPVKVNVNLIRKDDPDAVIPEGQRFFKVRHTNISGTSFVTSPIWRMGWGFFLTGCPEAAMINWSPRHPGTINMNDYGRFYYEAPGTDSYIMNNNSSVNAREVEMALRAHETGKMQYFPYKISLRKYFGRLFSKFTRRIIK